MARNILFTYVPNLDVSSFIDEHLGNTTDTYSKRIAFLGETGLIMTRGEIFAASKLSENYEMSELLNSSSRVQPNDSMETAFGKLEKAIIDNEYTYTNAFIYLDENKLNSSEISTVGLSNDYNDLDNLPVIPSVEGFATEEYVDNSINILKDYVDSSLVLSSSYVMSPSTNEDLFLQPNDRFETAFSKLEKAIIDNEESITNAFIYIDENKLNSSEISTVGLSNDYNDLDNLPTLSDFVTKEYVDTSINLLSETLTTLINDVSDNIIKEIENDEEVIVNRFINVDASINELKDSLSSLDDIISLINDVSDNIIKELEDDEEVIVNKFINVDASINELKDSLSSLDDIIDLINDVSDNIINELEKDELVIVNRFINVDASINELKDSLSSLDDIIGLINDVSDNIIKEIEDDEEVIATALTTLNTSINLLSSSLNTDIDDLKNDTSTLSYIIERLNNLGKIVNVETLTSAMTIDAYKIYKLGTVDQTVTISFDTTTEISGYSADYTIIFTADTSCSIILPNTCLYANNITPVYVTGRTYEINISNNLVVVTSFY